MQALRKQVLEYLKIGKVMQLATLRDNSPWVCSVYYVADDDLNVYWLSYPSRRHSIDIAINNKVAITIVLQSQLPVIGVQAEGTATEVTDIATMRKMMPKYVKKYGAGKQFVANAIKGIHKHRMYRFSPRQYTLFDEENFGHNNPQVLKSDES